MSIRKKPIKKVTFRVNEMLVAIISIYILLVSIQMWLLFGTINKALDSEHLNFAFYSGVASVIIFLCTLFFLRYIPDIPTGKKTSQNDDEEDNEY
ncbi:DUF6755 family protein [Chryseobacterium sp. CT-SW4]|uniref:DUF6755 family protein n=1 Tax=Chryseobacterium sp. SW-1 TaxID=3157343 RepID=UPI003B0251AE